MSLAADDLALRPDLVLIYPFGHEGQHTVSGTDKVLYLDHGWDETFGYAFGTVIKVAPNVTDVAPGDFVTFVRHAYEPWTDRDGDELLFVNTRDIEGVITPDNNEEFAKGIAGTESGVERYAA